LAQWFLHQEANMTGTNASCRRLLVFTATAILCGTGAAQSGPCTPQIAQLEQQIAGDRPGPSSGPTATQSVGAQLHHQPTPNSVGQAEHVANADGDLAIERAKKADAAGDATGCDQALVEARRLYDVKQ
jgi:hypothetical protein